MIYPKTFRKQVFLTFIILAFLPIIIMVTITLTVIRNIIIQRSVIHLETVADLTTHHINEWMAQGRDSTNLVIKLQETQQFIKSPGFLSNTNSWLSNRKGLLSELQSLANTFPYVRSISLLHPTSGRVEISTDPILKGRFRNKEIYFKGGLEKIFISPTVYSVGREKPILNISGPIKNNDDKILAVVATEMDLTDLEASFKNMAGLGRTGRSYLVDAFGFNITVPQGEEGGPLRTIVESEGVKLVLSKRDGFSVYQDNRGIQVLGIYRWIESSKMGLLVEIEYSEVIQPIKQFWMIFFLLGSGLFALAIMAAIRMSKLLVTPIKNISETAKALQDGDLSRRAEMEGADEIKQLATTFNDMAESIQTSHGDLEKLVEQRTSELMQSNEKLKASLKEKEVLLGEIHHRVKNNMQVIISLLKLQSDKIEDKKYAEMLQESQNRILSMALVHEQLYLSEDFANIDFGEYVKSFVNGLFVSYGVDTNKVKLNIDIKDVSFDLENAIPCGLIINELASNSLKHAFPQQGEGNISIILQSVNEDELELTVSDNGIGIPEGLDISSTESMGLHIVRILAEQTLEGKMELNRTEGTQFHFLLKRAQYKPRI